MASSLSLRLDLRIEGGSFQGAMLRIQGKETLYTEMPAKSRMQMPLPLDSVFVISFSRPGYITKRVKMDTRHTPANAEELDYRMGIVLFPQIPEVELVIYNQPVASVHFNPGHGVFEYDTDYTKSILHELDEAEKLIHRYMQEHKSVPPSAPAAVPGQTDLQLVNQPVRREPLETFKSDSARLWSGSRIDYPEMPSRSAGDKSPDRTGSAAADFPIPQRSGQGHDEEPLQLMTNAGHDVYTSFSDQYQPQLVKREEIQEKNRQIILYTIRNGEKSFEVSRIRYNWGAEYFFRNGRYSLTPDLFNWMLGQ